jgi:hypothetical protein
MKATATLPASVAATGELKVSLQVIQGCAVLDSVVTLERTPNTLKLQVNGTETVPCPAVPNAVAREITYTDAGSPARTGPFRVWVNGDRVGMVAVQ